MTTRDIVPVVGLVGGVGSGKSTLARRLASSRTNPSRKIIVIDGDRIGHQALQHPHVKEQIQRRFGDSVFTDRGDVNRSVLAGLVFGNTPEQRQARTDLERIVHPHIQQEFARQIAAAKASPDVEAVLLDAAVLLEAGWKDLCDAVVFVETPEPLRRERVATSRGWDEHELTKRESSQLPLESKRNAADFVVENAASPEEGAARLEPILRQLRRRPV